MRRERGLLWVVLAGFVAGLVVVAAVAVGGGDDEPERLPALAIGSGGRAAAMAEGAASDMAFPAQRVEYRLGASLPDLPDEAPVYGLSGAIDEADVRRLADALGLDGVTVAREGDSWVARTDDRELRVQRSAGAPWYLSPGVTQCVGPDAPDAPVSSDDGETTVTSECVVSSVGRAFPVEVEARAAEEGTAEGREPATQTEPAPPATVEPCPMPDCPPGAACAQVCPVPPSPMPVPPPEPPERPADLPTEDEAERIARETLEDAGADLTGARVRVEDGFDQWYVNVDPVVDGVPTFGLTSSVGVGPKGEIRFANGWLGDPQRGEDYPLATVERALERFPSTGGGGGWAAYAADDRVMAATPSEGGGEGGEAPEMEPVVRTITDVRLGLMFAPLADGVGGMLVPAYLFTVEGEPGSELPAIAVADEYLPKPPVDEPVPEPAPLPPGGSGTGSGSGGSTGSAGGGCAASGSSDGVEVQLCGPNELEAGEEASFTLTVVHPRGAFLDSGCAEPTVFFGDGSDDNRGICDIGCAAPEDGQAKKYGKTFTHTYAQPGRYTAAAFVRFCEEGSGDLRVELPVVVGR